MDLLEVTKKKLELKRKQEAEGMEGEEIKASLTPSTEQLFTSESAELLAVSLLDSSSNSIRRAVGEHLNLMLQPSTPNEEDEEGEPHLTRQEVEALILLARSKHLKLSNLACEFVAKNLDLLPRGKLATSQVLLVVNKLMEFGLETCNFLVLGFALQIGTVVAKEGEIWAERALEQWHKWLDYLLLEVDISYEFRLLVLKCCAMVTPKRNAKHFLRACLKSIAFYPEDAQLVLLACETLLKMDQIELEEDIRLLLESSRAFCLEKNYVVAGTLLSVLHSKSSEQSSLICDLFEDCEVMETINQLYRSQSTFPAGKLESALFLEALLVQQPELAVAKMVHLCECGLIIRLIRLASPSSGGSKTADEENYEQHAFLPAIRCLLALAKVERIGARIVLAGGLGPLFFHANSNRNTRTDAKRALAALGVTNLGAVVESWIKTFKSAGLDEEELQPLSALHLFNGKSLMMSDPPPGFFTDTINDPNNILGRGAFSTVYKNQWQGDGELCAVKRLTKAAAMDPGFAEEIRVLARIPAHPNIISLYGVYLDDVECLICSEFGGPTLNSVVAKMDWRARVEVLLGIAEALRHLHGLDPCVLHLDLKASNVLVVNGQAKLCDFGLAVELRRGFEFLLPGEHGTIQYMAPEVMREDSVELGRGFDSGADVYSFAMIMWECAHPGRIPWQGEHFPNIGMELDITGAIRQAVISGRRPHCEDTDTWPKGYQILMEMCWKKHSSDRPTFVGNFFHGDGEQAVSHNNVVCSVALRRMVWECHKPVSKWPSAKKIISVVGKN
ncbi:hypothetical protein BASA81_007070 [Batrachochytrium salamandrivorans]|nr:hypothetical protein BASA81_007070 [Batrachochytrium salamandrivorans]